MIIREKRNYNMRKPMIYLASPHTHTSSGVREDRYRAALMATSYLIEQGNFVFSPIVHSHNLPMNKGNTVNWEFWKDFDTETITRMDELWVLVIPGTWESKGVKAEIGIAMLQGKVVKAVLPYYFGYNIVPIEEVIPGGVKQYLAGLAGLSGEKTTGV